MSKKKVCPICGTEMKIDTSVVCTSIPPMYRCVCPSCNCLDFIKTSEYDQYKEQPSLSSELDEAADKYATIFTDKKGHKIINEPTKENFKAGAEWMAQQGVSYETVISADKTIPVLPMKDVSEMGFDYGERVIIQIRKK